MDKKFNHTKIMPYPTDHTLGTFHKSADIQCLVDQLKINGIDRSKIDVLKGQDGINMIDLDGSRHSVTGKLTRLFQKFWDSGEWNFFKDADKELHNGHCLISVETKTQAEKNHVAQLMKKNHGHSIKYFNSMYVEKLD